MHSLRASLSRWIVTLLASALVIAGLAAGNATASAPAEAASSGKSLSSDHVNTSGHDAAPSAAGDVSDVTWMHDLAAHIWYRTLSKIVLPGSHDSGSYSLGDAADPFAFGVTQTDDLIDQLNDGMRVFDIRVEWHNGNWYAHHGTPGTAIDAISNWLTLEREFKDIEEWVANTGQAAGPGPRDQEIIMLHFVFDHPGNNYFPTNDCADLGKMLGDALVTPNMLQVHHFSTDPGQVTLEQLWSLPDPNGYARVIIDDNECMDDANPAAGQWSSAIGPGGLFSGYYADQVAARYNDAATNYLCGPDQKYGIIVMDEQAAQQRLTGLYGGEPTPPEDPKVGGLYNLGIEGTPEIDCLYTPAEIAPEQVSVLSALWQDWRTNAYGIGDNINILSGDFVQDIPLMNYVIAMDESLPVEADQITRLGPDTLSADAHQAVPSFSVYASYQGHAVPGAQVNILVNPADGSSGPNLNGLDFATATSDAEGVATFSGVYAGPRAGTWTITAGVAEVNIQPTWKLTVMPSSGDEFEPVGGNPTTLPVTRTTSSGFAVRLVDTNTQQPVANEKVTFNAPGAGQSPGLFGNFVGGADTVTVTTDKDGVARSPAYQAGTLAFHAAVQVSAPLTPALYVGFTVTPGPLTKFVVTSGDSPHVAIDSALPEGWVSGHWVDQYGNTVTDVPKGEQELRFDVDHTLASWPNGDRVISVTPSSNGTISAPALRVGRTLLNPQQLDLCNGLGPCISIFAGGLHFVDVQVTAGPPSALTVAGGDGQHTETGKPFAQPLAAKVTDAAGNPIPDTPVTFQVTAGAATFAQPNLSAQAAKAGISGSATPADASPPSKVVVFTDTKGSATAPVLTARQSGPVEVTASANGVPADKNAVFHLSATGTAPTAPTITNLTNGDGQVTVGFSGANPGTSPITSYEVSATDQDHPTAPAVTATGDSSPITVTGLTNGDAYVFTVTAMSADGNSPPSAQSGRLNVGVAAAVTSEPADGVVGQAYSSGFTVTGEPTPTVTQISGTLPPGLTLGSDGKLTGTPTQAGSYNFTVHVDNHVGQVDKTVTVNIFPPSTTTTTTPPSSTTTATAPSTQ